MRLKSTQKLMKLLIIKLTGFFGKMMKQLFW